jgi:alkylhydroperoxidase family enzyme
MPRVQPVSIDAVPPEAEPVFARFMAERGNVPNMFRTLAVRPEIMTAFDGALHAVLKTGALPLRLKELVAVRVSQLNECRY